MTEVSSQMVPTSSTNYNSFIPTASPRDKDHSQEQTIKLTNSHCSSLDSNYSLSDSDDDDEEEPKKLTRKEKLKQATFVALPLLTMLIIDIGLPLAIYYICKKWLSQLVALIISGIPPLLWVIYVFWKKRRIDILGCIIVFTFVLSAVLSVISGDVRLALLRDSTVTAIVSVVFLVTLIPLRTKWFTMRPLIFLISKQILLGMRPTTWTDANGKKHEIETIEWTWKYCSVYRKYCYILCAIWGILLMAEFAAKVIMIQSTLSVDQVVLYGSIMMIVIVVVMTTGTIIVSHWMTKRIKIIAIQWTNENDFTPKKKKRRSNDQHDHIEV